MSLSIYGFISAFLFGLSIIITQLAVNDSGADPVFFSALVALFATIIVTPYVYSKQKLYKQLSRRHWVMLLSLSFLSGVVGFILLRIGQTQTTAGNAGLISSLTSVTTMIASAIFLKEYLRTKQILLLPLIAFFLSLVLLDYSNLSLNRGDIFVFGMASVVGVGNIISTPLIRKWGARPIAMFRVGAAGVMLIPFLAFNASWTWWAPLSGLLLVLFTTTFYKAIEDDGPNITTMVIAVYPPIVALMSWLIFDEAYSLQKIIGTIGVVASIYALSRTHQASKQSANSAIKKASAMR